MSDLIYELRDRVALITLNRPQAMNAFGGSMREALLDYLSSAAADARIGCVVITGAGDAFCAGGDIASMAALQAANDSATIEQRMAVGAAVIRQMRSMPQPVIACVNGAAAGAGLNLALACDLRFAASSARFAASFVKIGLIPDWAGHYLLTRLAGTAAAMELMMTGERIDAEEALRLRLVNRVFPKETLFEETWQRARALAAGPRDAIAAIKRGTYLGATGSLDEVIDFEREQQFALFLGTDAREGMQAFLEKRAARFGQAQEMP